MLVQPLAKGLHLGASTKAEYLADMGVIKQSSGQIYQYLNFDQIEEYVENAKEATA